MLLPFTKLAPLVLILLLPSTVTSLTLPPRAAGDSATSQLLQIAPNSSTCTDSPFRTECATNEQAAPFLIAAVRQYNLTSAPEIAAVLALIAFESGEFKYNRNHFPGRPGQGTRAMFMPNFVLDYAQSIPALSSSLSAINVGASPTDEQPDAILALVLPDEYSWASAMWFLTTQCTSVRPALQAGGMEGFEAYMDCVGTVVTSERLIYWERASTAFGLL